MKELSKQIQRRYEGYLHTPSLWKRVPLFGLPSFQIDQKSMPFNLKMDEKLRLGKYVERFVSFQLQQEESIDIIAENIQIQDEKITLGELDCILLQDQSPIHLEIVFKFYLFDPSVGNSELEHFIGPNRKDSLVEKLKKLRDKQLPLLYSEQAKQYLQTLDLNLNDFKQKVYFKAQLFLPYGMNSVALDLINPECICGFYLHYNEIAIFSDCKFYIPSKINWLIDPHTNVHWLSYEQYGEKVEKCIIDKQSPLCWLKKPNGELTKFFLVWW